MRNRQHERLPELLHQVRRRSAENPRLVEPGDRILNRGLFVAQVHVPADGQLVGYFGQLGAARLVLVGRDLANGVELLLNRDEELLRRQTVCALQHERLEHARDVLVVPGDTAAHSQAVQAGVLVLCLDEDALDRLLVAFAHSFIVIAIAFVGSIDSVNQLVRERGRHRVDTADPSVRRLVVHVLLTESVGHVVVRTLLREVLALLLVHVEVLGVLGHTHQRAVFLLVLAGDFAEFFLEVLEFLSVAELLHRLARFRCGLVGHFGPALVRRGPGFRCGVRQLHVLDHFRALALERVHLSLGGVDNLLLLDKVVRSGDNNPVTKTHQGDVRTAPLVEALHAGVHFGRHVTDRLLRFRIALEQRLQLVALRGERSRSQVIEGDLFDFSLGLAVDFGLELGQIAVDDELGTCTELQLQELLRQRIHSGVQVGDFFAGRVVLGAQRLEPIVHRLGFVQCLAFGVLQIGEHPLVASRRIRLRKHEAIQAGLIQQVRQLVPCSLVEGDDLVDRAPGHVQHLLGVRPRQADKLLQRAKALFLAVLGAGQVAAELSLDLCQLTQRHAGPAQMAEDIGEPALHGVFRHELVGSGHFCVAFTDFRSALPGPVRRTRVNLIRCFLENRAHFAVGERLRPPHHA